MGGVEVPGEKALEQRGSRQEKSRLCDRKRKRREKNSGRCIRTETNGKTGRIKERERKETREEGQEGPSSFRGLLGHFPLFFLTYTPGRCPNRDPHGCTDAQGHTRAGNTYPPHLTPAAIPPAHHIDSYQLTNRAWGTRPPTHRPAPLWDPSGFIPV